MEKVYYGGAIQGAKDRQERVYVNRRIVGTIRDEGFDVPCEHNTGRNKEETARLLEASIGPLPATSLERNIYIRNKMIEFVEGDICAAIFEVSIPSLGTGIEIAHAYLRPRMGLPEIPVLTLYEEGFWPQDLSSMIKGITLEAVPKLKAVRYKELDDAEENVREFLKKIKN